MDLAFMQALERLLKCEPVVTFSVYRHSCSCDENVLRTMEVVSFVYPNSLPQRMHMSVASRTETENEEMEVDDYSVSVPCDGGISLHRLWTIRHKMLTGLLESPTRDAGCMRLCIGFHLTVLIKDARGVWKDHVLVITVDEKTIVTSGQSDVRPRLSMNPYEVMRKMKDSKERNKTICKKIASTILNEEGRSTMFISYEPLPGREDIVEFFDAYHRQGTRVYVGLDVGTGCFKSYNSFCTAYDIFKASMVNLVSC